MVIFTFAILLSQPVSPLANRAWYERKTDYTFTQIFTEAWMAFTEGRAGRAITLLKLASERWPGHPLAPFDRYMQARLYLWLGDPVAAAGTLRRFIRQYPNDPNAHDARRWLALLDRALEGYRPVVVRRFLVLYDMDSRRSSCRRVLSFIRKFPDFPGNAMLARRWSHCLLTSKNAIILAGYLTEETTRTVAVRFYRQGRVIVALRIARGKVRLLLVVDLLLRAAFWLLLLTALIGAWRRLRSEARGACISLYIKFAGHSRQENTQDVMPLQCIQTVIMLAGSWAAVLWHDMAFGLAYAVTLWALGGTRLWVVLGAVVALVRYAVLMML